MITNECSEIFRFYNMILVPLLITSTDRECIQSKPGNRYPKKRENSDTTSQDNNDDDTKEQRSESRLFDDEDDASSQCSSGTGDTCKWRGGI
jgi:hypothetical protein